MIKLHWLDSNNDDEPFPEVESALREPDGLLAAGGSLSPQRLLKAYRHGVFPWYSMGQPILWWSPNPRAVLYPEQLHISRSLQKTLRKNEYTVAFDTAFSEVISQCAQPRNDSRGTWLTVDMIAAYRELHRLGYAHSAETWHRGELVGGVYGVAIGKVFFGESMFTRRTDASKIAFVHLVTALRSWGYRLIDCQVTSAHLIQFGAVLISRRRFIDELARASAETIQLGHWGTISAAERHHA